MAAWVPRARRAVGTQVLLLQIEMNSFHKDVEST